MRCKYLFLDFGEGDLFVPRVLLDLLQRHAQTGDGVLELVLLPVDPLHVGRGELLVLQDVLQSVTLLLQGLQVTACRWKEPS